MTEADAFAGGTFPRTGDPKTDEPLGENGIQTRTVNGTTQTYDETTGAWSAPATASFTVTLTDNSDGTFTPTYSYGNTGVAFTNTYTANGKVLVAVTKYLAGER